MDRRLAAILHADVVGYSRLMEGAETRTFRELKTLFDGVWLPALGRHGGRLVNTAGDAMLVEFGSAVAAVRCAMELQVATAERNTNRPPERHVTLRIGLNIGEVIVDGENIFGDEVNLAARIQALAEPGTVVVSTRVRESVEGKVAFGFDDLGDRSVKNISRPVRVHRVVPGAGPEETILPVRAAPAPSPRPAGPQSPTVSAPVSRSGGRPASTPVILPPDALEPLIPDERPLAGEPQQGARIPSPPPLFDAPPSAYTPPAPPPLFDTPPSAYTPASPPLFDAGPPGYTPPPSPLFGPSPVPAAPSTSPLFDPLPAGYTPPPASPAYSPPAGAPAWMPAGGPLQQPVHAPATGDWRLVGADRVGTPVDMRLDAARLEQPDGVVFGRLPRYCHLTIENDSISRRHARFKAVAGGMLTVEDLGSTNGTAVDSQKIEPYRPVPIRDGSRLSLGEIKVVVSRA